MKPLPGHDHRTPDADAESERLRRILDSANDGFFFISNNTLITDVNPRFCDILGRERNEIIGKPVSDFIHPDDRPLHARELKLRDRGEKSIYEIRLTGRDGSLVPVQIKASPYIDDTGTKTGAFALVTDISAERKTRDQLIESREQFRLASEELKREKDKLSVTLSAITEAVITTNLSGRIEFLNESACRLTGYSEQEALGAHFDDIIILAMADDYRRGFQYIEEAIITRQPIRYNRHMILPLKFGDVRLCMLTVSPLLDRDGRPYGATCVIIDDTVRVRINEELIKSNRIESLGIFAGGIAHDFNNLLTTILGNISLARQKYSGDSGITNLMDTIEGASATIKHLSQQLLTFAKGGEPIKKIVSMKRLVKESVAMAMSGSDIAYTVTMDDQVFNCEADDGQIRQVLNNIIINAQQAILADGVITVRLKNRIISINEAHTLDPGNYVEISVTDNGGGIPEEIIQNIYDPYFTTKEKGHGLGLAVTYSIINRHNGAIECISRKGLGTTFIILLPASDGIPENDSAELLNFSAEGKSALVMDDDAAIRSVLKMMLEKIGYTVDTAEKGEDALVKYRETLDAGEPYTLVIMDLTIPGGMGGKDTMKKLQELDPNAAVIVSSGYSNDPVMANFREYGFSAVLTKPYVFEDLKQTLSVMKKSPSGA